MPLPRQGDVLRTVVAPLLRFTVVTAFEEIHLVLAAPRQYTVWRRAGPVQYPTPSGAGGGAGQGTFTASRPDAAPALARAAPRAAHRRAELS